MEFNFTRNQILQKACRLAGVTDEGEMPNSDLLASAADSLKIILKIWRFLTLDFGVRTE